MIRGYFNSKAAIWDDIIAKSDSTKLQAMADRLQIARGSRVLDVGTGTGVFIPYLQNKVGEQGELIALDIAEEMLKVLQNKGYSLEITLIQADIAFSPFISGYFDAVVCYSTFPHFQDKTAALMEIFRLLKADGVLYICHTSSRRTINDIHRSIPDVCKDIIPDAGSMKMMLEQSGFHRYSIDDLPESYYLAAGK